MSHFSDNKETLFKYFFKFLIFNFRQYQIYKFYENNFELFNNYPPAKPAFTSTFLRAHILGLAMLLDPVETGGYENFSAKQFDLKKRLEEPEINKIACKIVDIRRKLLAHQDLDFVVDRYKVAEIDLKRDDDEVKLLVAFVQIAKNFAESELGQTTDYIDKEIAKTEEETKSFLNTLHSIK